MLSRLSIVFKPKRLKLKTPESQVCRSASAMAIPSAFRERLEQMEQSRNERLSILQSEKELQQSKSQVLASRLFNIASMEQRCLKLDRKIASQYLFISSLKSRLHLLDADYLQNLQKHRDLKDEVDNWEELEKEEHSYYSLESREMEEFREQVANFLVECHVQVEELRNQVNELKARFAELQCNLNHSNNSEIAAAEIRKTELVATKENLEKNLALNYQLREQLTNLLLTTLMGQSLEKK